MNDTSETTWPDFAEGLYERLTGRGASITYRFDEMNIEVPRSTGENPARAHWTLSGGLTVTTSEPTG